MNDSARGQPAAIDRDAMLARLARETFDLAIIGGGINGAAIAREAAIRGARVALVDRGDFAGATSSQSSKLIHGGLRYLPQGQFRLVFEALRERERMRRVTAPYLVHPIRFLMPFYRARRPGRLALLAGLTLYDLMARTPRAERHHWLSAADVLNHEAALRTDNLSGGAIYFDGCGDDARLTLENALDAAYHDAAIANYVAVIGITHSNGSDWSLHLQDRQTDSSFDLRARRIINAAGPWADDIRRIEDPRAAPAIRLSKGVHLVIAAERMPLRNSLVLTTRDGRIIFAMLHNDYVLIGTTDTDYIDSGNSAISDKSDIDYLLNVLNDALPEFQLRPSDVEYTFAGIRALPLADAGDRPSSVPRDEVIVESAGGMITVAGGKLTTHRAIAEKLVDRISSKVKGGSPTRTLPLPGARSFVDGASGLDALPSEIQKLLRDRYGARAPLVAAIAAQREEWRLPLCDGAPAIAAEAIFSIRFEWARTIEDFLIRRTAMAWRSPRSARRSIPRVARLMAAELGWNASHEQQAITRAQNQLRPPLCE